MKKTKFNKLETVKRINADLIIGGANKSDVNYTDTKHGFKWDVGTQKLIDVEDTSRSNDNPRL